MADVIDMSLDDICAALKSLNSLDIERLFDRMDKAEAERLFVVAFCDEICRADDLEDELKSALSAADDAVREADELREEVADLKEDLKSVEIDRDLLQGRIHNLTGEVFDG